MVEHDYQAPVDRLLTYGDARNSTDQWPNYLALGLTEEHVPDLLRMVNDPVLNNDDVSNLEIWAPIHALRALGQLHAETAIASLIQLFDKVDDDDALFEELPEVLAAIGPAAISAIFAYLDNLSHMTFARVTVAAEALTHIAQKYPETRQVVIEKLTSELGRSDRNDSGINGFLVSDLIELKAIESAATIKAAYYADKVDPTIVGDWYDIRGRLGLDPAAEVPGPDPLHQKRRILPGLDFLGPGDQRVKHSIPKKIKNKRKQEKKSRKMNRKKK